VFIRARSQHERLVVRAAQGGHTDEPSCAFLSLLSISVSDEETVILDTIVYQRRGKLLLELQIT
jgi:hypothetical protein